LLDAIETACRDVGWQVRTARVSITGAEPRPALLIQRGRIEVIAVNEASFIRLCWLLQLNAEEIGRIRGLSIAGRRRLQRNLERLCSDGRTVGSIFEEPFDGESTLVGVMIEQRLVAAVFGPEMMQRAVDGLVEIAVIARRVASALANLAEADAGLPRRPGAAGPDPMVG
jgi:hypothetical protein